MLAEALFGRTQRLSQDRGPTSNFWYDMVSPPVASKVDVNVDTAMTYSAVWAATRLLCGTGGWLPLNLYKRRSGGGQDIQREDARHRMVHLRPNGEMTSMMYRSSQFNHQINGGNCYAEIQRVNGTPYMLWPIHPKRVQLKRDKETTALIYEIRNDNGAPPSHIPAKDMLHVPSMISTDGISGKGVIQHARESIGFGIATERHGASFFGSGAIPRIVIKHPKTLSQDARKQFRSEWKEIYGGPTGDDVALLSEGAELMPINISNEDSQFLGSREYAVEEIARWYGIPPHLLQRLIQATFNNVEQLGTSFVVFSLIAWLKLWEQELGAKLLTEREQASYYFGFNVNALLRGDSKTRSEYYRSLMTLAVLSPNDVRELEDLNPFAGGDSHYIQGAMVPIGPDGMLMLPKPPEPAVDEPQDDTEEPEETPSDKKEDDPEDGKLAAIITESALDTQEQIARLRGELSAQKPEAPDMSALGKREEMLKVSARHMLGGATGRIVRKTAQAARRAAKTPNTFLEWNDSFAEKNKDDFVRELEPCLQAFSAIGIDANADTIVAEHLTTAHSELLEASGSPPDMFPASIEACVSNWEDTRAQEMADSVYQITIPGE